jgi:hypothetical protein
MEEESLLTLFALPKAFRGHFGIIQRNAITSWTLLRPRPEIVLFGDETGTAEIMAELGLRHNPEVARNELGTPLLDGLFAKAQADPRADLLCYVNADVILLQDFMEAVERTRDWAKRFLIVGQCWDTDIAEPLGFDRPDWEEHLRDIVRSTAKQRSITGIDYFVFPAGLFSNIPPFGIGRPFWDNWFLWQACRSGVALVDATAVTTVIHQNHPISWTWTGPEEKRNFELAGGWHTRYSIANSQYRLTSAGIVRNWARPLRARWELRRQIWISNLINWTRPARHALGLNQQRLDSIKKFLAK